MASDLATKVESLGDEFVVIVCAGFEERARRLLDLLRNRDVRPRKLVVGVYPERDEAHQASRRALLGGGRKLVSSGADIYEVSLEDPTTAAKEMNAIAKDFGAVLCDISAMSRLLMLNVLTHLRRSAIRTAVAYTEAAEYYPTYESFREFLDLTDRSEGFAALAEYERKEVVYSPHSDVEPISPLMGHTLPNSPVFLVSFLTFKRSRLGAVLRHFESNRRIFVKPVPAREDLRWRIKALEVINFDLIDESDFEIVSLPTAEWRPTYEWLRKIYEENNNQYRYNFIVAPLGSKLQTLGAWRFAVERPEIRVVTATPKRLFRGTFSRGFGETWIVSHDDLVA